jgi:hypothetical protein
VLGECPAGGRQAELWSEVSGTRQSRQPWGLFNSRGHARVAGAAADEAVRHSNSATDLLSITEPDTSGDDANEDHKMPTKPKKPRKEPAERVLIIDEWDEWAKGKVPNAEKGTDEQGLEFYDYLGREKPRLLEFKYAGNRWQQVKVWLREFERISR